MMGIEASPRVRMFCFPHAGGGNSFFHGWSRSLGSQIEVLPVQLPGHETRLREAPFDRLVPLVQVLIENLDSHFKRPFVLFGHSLGALLAFEFARQLRQAHLPLPLGLYLSARRAPQLPDTEPPLHHLPDDELTYEIQQRYGGIPKQILEYPELLEIFLPVLRTDFAMVETYQYQAQDPFDFPITCYGGADDPMTTHAHLMAWQAHTRGDFKVNLFPGGHFYLQAHKSIFLDKFAADLASQLSNAFIES